MTSIVTPTLAELLDLIWAEGGDTSEPSVAFIELCRHMKSERRHLEFYRNRFGCDTGRKSTLIDYRSLKKAKLSQMSNGI